MVILDKAPRKSGSAPDAEGGSMVFLGGYSAVFGQVWFLMVFRQDLHGMYVS